MDRPNRGGSFMDRYNSNSQSYDSGRELKIPCCSRLGRLIILWVNIIFGVLGLVIIALGIYTYTQGDVSYLGEVNAALFALALVLGILILILSTLGCMSARMESRCMSICYLLGLCAALILEIVIAALVFNPNSLKGLMSSRWNKLSDAQRSHIESEFHCCSFDGESASSSSGTSNSTTTTSSSCPGCYSSIEKSLHDVQVGLGVLAILMICYEVGMVILVVLVFWARKEPKKEQKEKVPDGFENPI